MSNEFVQFIFPCTECLVRAACKDKVKNNDNNTIHLYDNVNPRCLAVPKLSQDVTYMKGLIECCINLGTSIQNSMRKTEDPHTCRETNNNIPMQYVILMGQIAYLLQWIINSQSWSDGILHEFDRIEIKNKLKAIVI